MRKEREDIMANEQKVDIYLDPAFAELTPTIESLYKRLLNKQLNIVQTAEQADVIVTFSVKSKELFAISVAEKITIYADCSLAAFRGVMYVAKQIKTGAIIQTSEVHEQLTERILMLDIGRKYFSPTILYRFLEQMALNGFNYLQLHFSENSGFRIESVNYPELVSPKYITKDEIKDVICYARKLWIEIIPDIDTPGHMEQLLQSRPEWQLDKVDQQGNSQKVPSALAITNEEAIEFVLSIYREYMELFATSRYLEQMSLLILNKAKSIRCLQQMVFKNLRNMSIRLRSL